MALRGVLNDSERLRVRKLVEAKNGSLKEFASQNGFSYHAFICWLKVGGKKRQPTLEVIARLESILQTRIRITEYQSNNSRTKVLPKVAVDDEFALVAGLFSAEGDKKSTKRISITNSDETVIETVANYFAKLDHDGSKTKIYYYHPNAQGKYDERHYINKKSSKTCVTIALYDCFLKMAFDDAMTELHASTGGGIAAKFLQGVLCGDGCISFDAKRKYYEVCIALEEAEAEKTRRALGMLGIEFKEKTRGKVNLLTVHKKYNFEKILAFGGFSLMPAKNEKLKMAIANYTYSRK